MSAAAQSVRSSCRNSDQVRLDVAHHECSCATPVGRSGVLLLGEWVNELGVLQDLNAKLVRIQFEITKQEKEALAASLQKESLTVPLIGYDFSTATDDERVYWPFLGEYWRDELGTYMYTLTHGCRPPSDEG